MTPIAQRSVRASISEMPFTCSLGDDTELWLPTMGFVYRNVEAFTLVPGDTIAFTGRVVAKRPSESKPGWGLVTVETTGVNQKDERVFVVTGHVFAARQAAE